MTDRHVLVLGAGPAGMQAAITARRHGLRVTVIDEGVQPGGQIFRAPGLGTAAGKDTARGDALRTALRGSGATLLSRHRAWGVAEGPRVDCLGPDGAVSIAADALIIATGTTERVIPMPGCTLPGVIGLAAATILLKAHDVVPGTPTVVAGVGPLLYAVAAGILKAGGEVAAVVDLLAPADWIAALPALLSRPDLLARGLGWMAALKVRGVAIHHRATVTAILGSTGVEAVEIGCVAGDWSVTAAPRRTLAAAGVAIGHGLAPATEAARLLGIRHRYDAAQGHWVPMQPTPVGIHIAGDCAGIAGAAAAEFSGILAGLTAALELGAISTETHADLAAGVRQKRHRAERFGRAISAMMALRPGLAASLTGRLLEGDDVHRLGQRLHRLDRQADIGAARRVVEHDRQRHRPMDRRHALHQFRRPRLHDIALRPNHQRVHPGRGRDIGIGDGLLRGRAADTHHHRHTPGDDPHGRGGDQAALLG